MAKARGWSARSTSAVPADTLCDPERTKPDQTRNPLRPRRAPVIYPLPQCGCFRAPESDDRLVMQRRLCRPLPACGQLFQLTAGDESKLGYEARERGHPAVFLVVAGIRLATGCRVRPKALLPIPSRKGAAIGQGTFLSVCRRRSIRATRLHLAFVSVPILGQSSECCFTRGLDGRHGKVAHSLPSRASARRRPKAHAS